MAQGIKLVYIRLIQFGDEMAPREQIESLEWASVLSARAAVDAVENHVAQLKDVLGFRKKFDLPKLTKAAAWRFLREVAEETRSARAQELHYPVTICDLRIGTVETKRFAARRFGLFHDRGLPRFAKMLADKYGWTESSAAGWLICEDADPYVEDIIADPPRLIGLKESRIDLAQLVRVKLDIHVDVPPGVVAERWAEIREGALRKLAAAAERSPSTRRPRAFQLHRISIVTFAAQRNDGRSWESILNEWKRTAPPEWREKYPTANRFGTDVREAYKQLMGRSWKSGLAEGDFVPSGPVPFTRKITDGEWGTEE